MSNEIKNSIKALEIDRNKELIEKAFGNLKEGFNLRSTAVSSESSLDGKLFVQFVALIYMSYLKRRFRMKVFPRTTQCRSCWMNLMLQPASLARIRLRKFKNYSGYSALVGRLQMSGNILQQRKVVYFSYEQHI